MINDLKEYQKALHVFKDQLDDLVIFRAKNQEIEGINDVRAITCTYESYERIGNMIKDLFDDVDFSSAHTVRINE